jgi:FkbM family methyltransferase
MLIPLDFLVKKYNIQFTGILHVGAHECEELSQYDNYLLRNNMLWIEALQDKVDFCKKTFPNILIEQAVVSDCVETVTFNRANNGQSSSFLEFGLHSFFHSQVEFVESYQTETKMLKDIICNYNIPFNFVNLDIQGVELKALKGMGAEYLNKVQYIYSEVNSDYVYKNCAIVDEIDEYLKQFGFERVETSWCSNFRWGDAFYVKK